MPYDIITRPYQWPESYYQFPISGTYPTASMRLPVSGTSVQPHAYHHWYPQYQYYQYIQPYQTGANLQPQIWYPAVII